LRQRERQGLAEPFLGERRVVPCQRVLRERDEVLDLDVRVAGACKPCPRLLPESLCFLEIAAQVLDQRERERGQRLLSAAAELGGERRAPCELFLGGGEIADVVEQESLAQVSDDAEWAIVDLFRDADRVT